MATRESANLKLTLEDNEEFAGIEVTAENFNKIDEAFGQLKEQAENASKNVTVSVIKNGVTVSASKSFDALKAEFEKGNEILCELTVTGDEAVSGGICTVCGKTDTALLFFTWIQGTLWLVKGAASGWEVTSFQPAGSGHSHLNATQAKPGFLSAEDKTKLDGIASNANNYSLPTASSTTLGGIKVGSNLSISNGVLSAEAGGVGKSLAGQSVSPTSGTSATAGEGAEIFNDYRDRTYELLNDKSVAKSGNIASGIRSHAEGSKTTASGGSSHAEGLNTTASGGYSHAEGYGTTASNNGSHAEGYETISSNNGSHAEGIETTASGYASHAEGSYTTASIDSSHAEGKETNASGGFSHAEGLITTASGDASHAEGRDTIAAGDYSHAGGRGTYANKFQMAIGKYNEKKDGCNNEGSQSADNSLFIVGNGTGDTFRSNALRTAADGQSFGLKAFGASGADFAEYFEWLDGNPNSEDRRGKFVTLDGDKIKLANAGDFIVGVVSSMAAFIGNTSSEQWQGRYLQDVFGDWIQEEVEIPEKTDELTGKVIPAHTAVQYALNPEYDATQEYVSRQFRKEWSPIGMLGQVVVVDDGTCTVGGFCNAGVDGVGTAAENGYKVMKRVDSTHVKVLVK